MYTTQLPSPITQHSSQKFTVVQMVLTFVVRHRGEIRNVEKKKVKLVIASSKMNFQILCFCQIIFYHISVNMDNFELTYINT